MTRAIVLGAGMVGSLIARDLAKEPRFRVTAADVRPEALARFTPADRVETLVADLGDEAAIRRAVEPFDVVVGALSSHLGLRTLRAVILARKTYCDISFMAEDPRSLDALAREHGVTCVVDCGVSPGVSNVAIGYAVSQLEETHRIEIQVGGLPVVRQWPYEYKAPFAPHDVIEEYTRPARIVENGKVVVREALSEPVLVEFEGVGTLEGFNTDGLRSLIASYPAVPEMLEKTLRYPGHIALMKVMRETGLFSKEPLSVAGATVRPLDVTAALLFPKWTFEEGEEDLTVCRVAVTGLAKTTRKEARYAWSLHDRYDAATRTRSMSRCTGFPASIMARLLADGRFHKPGVHPPEVCGAEPGILTTLLKELNDRGVVWKGPEAS
jgi:saccharopine dehydrogenase-like NADP-dependent oxidoreductase